LPANADVRCERISMAHQQAIGRIVARLLELALELGWRGTVKGG
jgi:hypothetical protein